MSKQISVQLNYFGPFIEKLMEEDIPKLIKGELGGERLSYLYGALFEAFFELPLSALSPEIIGRYLEVTIKETHLSIVPHTKHIYEKLLRPLKSAKRNYCLGDYLACIAACGVVGEMLSILIWKINGIRVNNKLMTSGDEKNLWGREFEKLGQEKRLLILKTFNLISETQFDDLNFLREIRRPYLHLWSTELKNERDDALKAVKKVFHIFKDVTGIGIGSRGHLSINPLLMKLFEEKPRFE